MHEIGSTDRYQVVTTWVDDCLRTCNLSRYIQADRQTDQRSTDNRRKVLPEPYMGLVHRAVCLFRRYSLRLPTEGWDGQAELTFHTPFGNK